MDLEAVAGIGRHLMATKWFSISMCWLWVYDYFLTLGDEVTYAWSGRRSWVFVLFVANRYIPVLHIIYTGIIRFSFTKSFCQNAKWAPVLYTTLIAILAQATVALRLYAITGKSKMYGYALTLLIAAQLCSGICFTIVAGTHPVQSLPCVDLDAYKICLFQYWREGELSFIIIAAVFDLLAFSTIFAVVRGLRPRSYLGIPTLLATVMQDATVYFSIMFGCQLLLVFFLFFAPSEVQLLPGVMHATLLPIMACRLMISLKKAACKSTQPSTLSNASEFEFGGGGTTSRSIEFRQWGISQASDESSEVLSPLVPRIEEDAEFGPCVVEAIDRVFSARCDYTLVHGST